MLLLLLFGTSIVAPACYGASIVVHALAGVFLLWSMLPPLMLPLLASLSVDVVIVVVVVMALPFTFASTLPTAVFCLIYCRAHRVSVFCLTYCCAYRVSVLFLIYCRTHRVSVFCLTYYCAHRVSVFCYVPYFLGFALVFPLRTLL
ncbi:hypothetical protein L3X38_006459 [Prunus dulcis]|uniref:Uncharacterized protein n=1 Tax=Prunus dulcis TaxID=3755 RepID=A0AAD4ZSU6_PRUDU|nr:hypothetical protein L3X38_006459 [Prunus dulcis]